MGNTFGATTRIVARAGPLFVALALVSCPHPPAVPAGAAPSGLQSIASVTEPPTAMPHPARATAGGVRNVAPGTVSPTARPARMAEPATAITDLAGNDDVMWVPQASHPLEPRRPPTEQLLRQLEELEGGWGGVLGVSVYDLAADRAVAGLHQDTVFSGASVLKAAIMLHAYAELPNFSQEQDDWLHQMIIDSDTGAANALLAASVGGSTSNDAARGALHMTAMLEELGLQHTYLRTPYIEEDVLPDLAGLDVYPGPEPEGAPPYTVADPWLRATPAEIGQLFLWIERCVQGRGPLPARFGATLTPERCREMIDLLEQNGDRSRLVAGMLEGTFVAHKSGWIGDTQADVGIVRSPGGEYVVAVFVYHDADTFDPTAAATTIAEASGVVYRYFNP